MIVKLGCLVRSRNNSLGIGKFIEISNLDAVIEYFCSIAKRTREIVPLNFLDRVRLQHHTRCYLWSESQEMWMIGRIFAWDELSCQYEIHLPDSKIALAAEEEVYVRCNLPIDDPIEPLAMKGQETPYFHDRRLAFIQNSIEQRAVSCGMTGLISANIALYPHQVEVVRRVLEDPIQRYLLADEVGLGKTVEAGAILRQYLLDEPQGCALVLVPQYLLEQWHQELENKFYISHFPNRVQVLAVDDFDRVRLDVDLGFLILDEAHHVAAMATSSVRERQQCFKTCKRLAHQAKRLLLLSATPVLNHERDFLAMLHLLDPTAYRLDDLEGFRERVQKRQEIGRLLLSFKEGAQSFVLKMNLKRLKSLFEEDEYLMPLAEDLESCLQNRETTSAERDRIVRAIRTHVSDTYRLHRRMLRNRRATVEDVVFERNATPRVEYDLDERSPDIHELIDEWRTVAPNEPPYRRIFLLLFRASGTWLNILKQVLESRLSGASHSELVREFISDDIEILIKTPKFSGEEEILQSLLEILQDPSEDGDRVELLKMVLLHDLSQHFKIQANRGNSSQLLQAIHHRLRRAIPSDRPPKIVVFTSFSQTCQEIVRVLSDIFGESAVASHHFGRSRDDVEKSIKKFKDDPNCFILACDRSGEEGRNLQFADWLIHFDLPWSPNQLEQRIGRLDRIGSKMGVQSCVLAGPDLPDSPHDAWYRLLKDGFGIFKESIASLQFYVDEKIPILETRLAQSGAEGILEAIAPIKQEIEAEKVKISEQNALDEIDALDEGATQYFQILDKLDACHQKNQRATEGWISHALQFHPIYDPNLSGVLRYKPTERTLVPVDDLQSRFAPYLKQFGTYNRRVANQHFGVNLYRIGEGLIEAIASYIQWDDRGQAFAMWRHDESWDSGEGMEWFGFRFNYIVETNLEAAKQILIAPGQDKADERALGRRADALFPPMLETIFLDARYEPMCAIEDVALLKILERPYKGKKCYPRDYNLAKSRLAILDEFVNANGWANFCRNARSNSEALLRDRPSFIDSCDRHTKNAARKLGNRVEQLRLRLNRLSQVEQVLDATLEQELRTETALSQALVEGIRHPRIRLDSVGFIIISGRPPAVNLQEEGDK